MKKSTLFLICLSAVLAIFFVARQLLREDPKQYAQRLLAQAGITINGTQPQDIIVHNDKLYARVLAGGSLALGESYMDGWWDCQKLDHFFYHIARSDTFNCMPKNFSSLLTYLKAKLVNLQAPWHAFQVGQQHYDLGNDLFKAMLDKRMLYSCAYWQHAQNLDEAQEDKCKLICEKLYLKPGMKVLDIGCGWGGLALYMAKNHGVHVVGITVSKEQATYAQEIAQGYPVEIRLQDYRNLNESFDRIVSVGMFEHVGYKNYKTFMAITHRLLKNDGIMLLHTIGSNNSHVSGDPWIIKYIFPNGMLPSIKQIAASAEGLFVMEDWHNFGADYDKTLMAWHHNFQHHWETLKFHYDERFYRMWQYYLLSCAGLFRARAIQLWQIVFSKTGVIGGYTSIR